MPDLNIAADAVLQHGVVMNLNGGMPIVGYNPELVYSNADMVETTSDWESQVFNGDASFRRDLFRNAASDVVRITGWYLENPPVLASSDVTTGLINSGNVTLVLTGTRFGTIAANARVLLRWTPDWTKGGIGRAGRQERAATISAISDVQITCSLSLNEEWRHSALSAQTGQLVVQRIDRMLESDPVNFTLTGGSGG